MRKLLFAALLVLILLPVSVAALGNNTNVSPEGNVIQPMFGVDIVMLPSPPNWGLAYGENSWFTIPGTGAAVGPYPQFTMLTIIAHAMQGVNYSITASDQLMGGKPPATKGFMAEYNYAYSNVLPLPPAVVNITSQGWVPGGKVLVKPLRLTNVTMVGVPPAPLVPVYKYFNLTGTDPVLFFGVGDTMPGAAVGPGTSQTFDINQMITLTDTNVRADPIPPSWVPPMPTILYQEHVYRLPITITLTAL